MKTYTTILLCFILAQISQCQLSQDKEFLSPYLIVLKDNYATPFLSKKNTNKLTTREARAKAFKKSNKQFLKKVKRDFKKAGLPNDIIIDVSAGGGLYVKVELTDHYKLLVERIKFIDKIYLDLPWNFDIPDAISLIPDNQTPDWGMTTVGGQNTSGEGKCAFVLDTGVFGDHPDLNVNKPLSTSFIPTEKSFKDLNGHGTHVSGIIAAKDNKIGARGVAAGATIIAVKVADINGQSQGSSVLFGADYTACVALPGDVANLSLGRIGTDIVIEDCIKNDLGAKGIFVSIAAGNSNVLATGYTPARTEGLNIYTVSNMDQNSDINPSSNFGNGPVDFAAPGTSIFSTDIKKNGLYSTRSGTSMSAPYVAGILLVNNGVVNSNGVLKTDKDAILDPIASIK